MLVAYVCVFPTLKCTPVCHPKITHSTSPYFFFLISVMLTYLFEQIQHKRLPVLVSRALVTPYLNGVPARLINTASDIYQVHLYGTIATLEHIERTQMCYLGDSQLACLTCSAVISNFKVQTCLPISCSNYYLPLCRIIFGFRRRR